MRPKCGVIGCNCSGNDPHHIWKGKGNRIPCVFQRGRKSGTPGGILHPPRCECNVLWLCRSHHVEAHNKGDVWLHEQTGSEAVKLKWQLKGEK